jgi:Cytochrome c554 and c-prime
MKLSPAAGAALCLLVACSESLEPLATADAGRPDAGAAGSGGEPLPPLGIALTPAQLRDPESCKECHPIHYREWSSSMHAYSAIDPVFVAMNQRGQRETGGLLGTFCVQCHAPMAVADGLTKDGLNLDQLPDKQRGVSCYFCHNAVDIRSDHNADVQLANDDVMRGSIQDPIEAGAHRTELGVLFDGASPRRSELCGGCHDIVTPNGIHIERTFLEYRGGLYATSATEGGAPIESCPSCHMPNRKQPAAAVPIDAPERSVHEHLWPGVDVALEAFPNRDAMRSAIEACQLGIGSVAFLQLEVTPPNLFSVRLETNAGHNQPSGAAQDRRMWIELLAYDADGTLIESSSSGNIGDLEVEEKPEDTQLFLLRDRMFDAEARPVHMFWQAAASAEYPAGYASNTLAVRSGGLDLGAHYVERQYRLTGRDGTGTPARVTARLRMRPIGMDVLRDLVASGDLDPVVVQRMPTFTFGAQLEWKQSDGFMNPISAVPNTDCKTYRCLLEPGSMGCN